MTDPNRYETLASFLQARKDEIDDLGPDTNQQDIGNAIGVTGAYVSQLIAGRANTAVPKWDGEKAYRFLRAFHLPTDRIRAIGESYNLTNVLKYLDPPARSGIAVREGKSQVQYMGTVSAGLTSPSVAEDETIAVDIPDYILKNHDPADIFAVDVNGDSMLSEDARDSLPQGTRVYFHTMLRPETGDIVCCRLEHQDVSVIKVYRPNETYVTLQSRNKAHRPIIIDEANPARLEGVYLGEVRTR